MLVKFQDSPRNKLVSSWLDRWHIYFFFFQWYCDWHRGRGRGQKAHVDGWCRECKCSHDNARFNQYRFRMVQHLTRFGCAIMTLRVESPWLISLGQARVVINRSLISWELHLRPALYVAGKPAEFSDLYAFLLSRHGLIVNQTFIICLFKTSSALPWEPEVFSRVRRGASSVAGRLVFGRAKTRAAKLWHPGYFRASLLNNGNACIHTRLKGLSV